MKKEWARVDSWNKSGKFFTVKVKHWINEYIIPELEGNEDHGHRWNVYVFIHKKHPLFRKVRRGLFTKLPFDMPWGNTYYQYHYDHKKRITTKEYGYDYQHLHQNHFRRMETREEAHEVFFDADKIFNIMKSMEDEVRE